MSRDLANYTRQSASIPRRLLREGKLHLLPVYALMLSSDLAREGIRNSGSFRFADHVYRNRPSGRWGVGFLLDSLLLRLRAARSLRNRYLHSREQIVREARRLLDDGAARITVVSAPCGIARELVEAAALLQDHAPDAARRVRFHGIDIDAEPLAISLQLAGARENLVFIEGDVFDAAAYPRDADVIASTGLADFLNDEDAVQFYGTCFSSLRRGGLLVTSAQQPQPLADFLMRELAELRARYRSEGDMTTILRRAGFTQISTVRDRVGLQVLVTARKPLES